MTLNKDDYSNILKLLEGVEIKGVQSAKYVSVLAHKLENRVAAWFDGHETGYRVQDIPTFSGSTGPAEPIPEPPIELNSSWKGGSCLHSYSES